MRILVTNDDGIDSEGLHVLVRSMCTLDGDHEVVVVAPDREFSGAGAALGALHLLEPEIVRDVDPRLRCRGVDRQRAARRCVSCSPGSERSADRST